MNMLSPKKTKYRKQFKGRIHGSAKGNFELNYGSYGLKALEPERITSRFGNKKICRKIIKECKYFKN